MTTQLAPKQNQPGLPPILAGATTPAIRHRVEQFFFSVASIFEAWVTRRQSPHTQRAYREDVMAFVKFMGIAWPDQATALLSVSIKDVLAFRDFLLSQNAAPKTLNRRISSLSSFYKYLAAAAAELRLPITVPNPAHAQFISPRVHRSPRGDAGAVRHPCPAAHGSAGRRQSVLDYRDRAILKFFLYSGARLATACRLKVSDFHQDGDEATIRLHEKGDKRRTIGLHFQAAQAIARIYREGRTDQRSPLPAAAESAQPKTGRPASWTPPAYIVLVEELPAAAARRRQGGQLRRRHNRPALHLHAPLPAGHHRHPAARRRRGHHARSRSCSATATSPPPRSTTSAAAARPRAPRTTCRFKFLFQWQICTGGLSVFATFSETMHHGSIASAFSARSSTSQNPRGGLRKAVSHPLYLFPRPTQRASAFPMVAD